jgi:DNA polymerase-3 subunit chi
MPALNFYHLTRRSVDDAVVELAAKVYSSGARLLIQCSSAERVKSLDDALWTVQPGGFLPHGSAKTSKNPAVEPIWITASEDDNPNAATVLLLPDTVDSGLLAGMEKVLILFDGRHTEGVAAARLAWKSYKAAGYALQYFQQTDRGGWELKAS